MRTAERLDAFARRTLQEMRGLWPVQRDLVVEMSEATRSSGFGLPQRPGPDGKCPPGQVVTVFGFCAVPGTNSLDQLPDAWGNYPKPPAPSDPFGIGAALAGIAVPIAIIVVVLFLSAKGVGRITS